MMRTLSSAGPLWAALLTASALLGMGCAHQPPSTPTLRKAGPEIPTAGISPFAQMAAGVPTRDHAVFASVELDDFLLPDQAVAAPQPSTMIASASPVQKSSESLLPAARTTPEVAAEEPETPEFILAQADPTPTELPPDATLYAERESQDLMQYRGGDVIVISASTLVIVLLVLILVLLLT